MTNPLSLLSSHVCRRSLSIATSSSDSRHRVFIKAVRCFHDSGPDKSKRRNGKDSTKQQQQQQNQQPTINDTDLRKIIAVSKKDNDWNENNSNATDHPTVKHHQHEQQQQQQQQQQKTQEHPLSGQQKSTNNTSLIADMIPSKIYSQFVKSNSATVTKKNNDKNATNLVPIVASLDHARERWHAHMMKKKKIETFITPGSIVTTPFYYHHGRSGNGTLRRTLPTIHAESLLQPDPDDEHAMKPRNVDRRRLRSDLLQVLREEVLYKRRRHHQHPNHHRRRGTASPKKTTTPSTNPPLYKSEYILLGHAIPCQLLQHILNMAETLLSREEKHSLAVECSFHNFHGDLKFEWMRIRGRDGTNHASRWNQKDALYHSMELYLAVMNRLACHLGLVLVSSEHGTSSSTPVSNSINKNNIKDEKHHEAYIENTKLPMSHWNVDIVRGLAYPLPLLRTTTSTTSSFSTSIGSTTTTTTTALPTTPTTTTSCNPIVEFMPRLGMAAPGHICIRLQGFAETYRAEEAQLSSSSSSSSTLRRKKRFPVTLVFNACFRNTTTSTR